MFAILTHFIRRKGYLRFGKVRDNQGKFDAGPARRNHFPVPISLFAVIGKRYLSQ